MKTEKLKVGQSFNVVNALVKYFGVEKGLTYPMIGDNSFAYFNGRIQIHVMIPREVKLIGKLTITKLK